MSSDDDDDGRKGRRYHRAIVRKKRKDRQSKAKEMNNRDKGPPKITHKRLTNKSGFFNGAVSTFVHSRGNLQGKPSKKDVQYELDCLLAAAKGKRLPRTKRSTSRSVSTGLDESPVKNDYWNQPSSATVKSAGDSSGRKLSPLSVKLSSEEYQKKSRDKPLDNSDPYFTVNYEITKGGAEHAVVQERLILSNKKEKKENSDASASNSKKRSISAYQIYAIQCIKSLDQAGSKFINYPTHLHNLQKRLLTKYERSRRSKKDIIQHSELKESDKARKLYEITHEGNDHKQLCDKAVSAKTFYTEQQQLENSLKRENNAYEQGHERDPHHILNAYKAFNEFSEFKEKSVELWVDATKEILNKQNQDKNGRDENRIFTLKQKRMFQYGDQNAEPAFVKSCAERLILHAPKFTFGEAKIPSKKSLNTALWTQPWEDEATDMMEEKTRTQFSDIFRKNVDQIRSSGTRFAVSSHQENTIHVHDSIMHRNKTDYFEEGNTWNKDVWKFAISALDSQREDFLQRETKEKKHPQSWFTEQNIKESESNQPRKSLNEPPLFNIEPATKRFCFPFNMGENIKSKTINFLNKMCGQQ